MGSSDFNPEVVVIGPLGGRVRIEVSIQPAVSATPVQVESEGEIIDVEAERIGFVSDEIDKSREIKIEEVDAPTRRELDVLRLVAQGYTNSEAGKALHIGVRTVETHRANLMAKWHVYNRFNFFRAGKERGYL